MSSIKLFVEGGGETNASGRGELRVAFDTLVRTLRVVSTAHAVARRHHRRLLMPTLDNVLEHLSSIAV